MQIKPPLEPNLGKAETVMPAARSAPKTDRPGLLLGTAMLARFAVGWVSSLVVTLVLIAAALIVLWRFVPPVSTLMLGRWVTLQPVDRTWVPLAKISPHLVAAVISSEDARFCRHNGVDWNALDDQLNAEDGPVRGASTIPMQTAKNLFLWPQRSFIRKGLEIPLAMAIGMVWSKQRTIEVYLNIAEWGDGGIFGAEAAARKHFGKSAAALTPREAALLATALPNPVLRNPARPGRHHLRLSRIIGGRARAAGPWLDCLSLPPAR